MNTNDLKFYFLKAYNLSFSLKQEECQIINYNCEVEG